MTPNNYLSNLLKSLFPKADPDKPSEKDDITQTDVNEIKSSGKFTPEERRQEYLRHPGSHCSHSHREQPNVEIYQPRVRERVRNIAIAAFDKTLGLKQTKGVDCTSKSTPFCSYLFVVEIEYC